MAFALDPQLEADTLAVCSLALCDVRLMNDARYVWLALVPRVADVSEIYDLSAADGDILWAEINLVARVIGDFDGVEKVNIGALGNIVRQLHVHVVGRTTGDPAWPGPVWGHSPRVAYDDDQAHERVEQIRALLG